MWMDKPNASTVPNTGFAIQCSVGAYVVGQLGSLNGTAGAKNVLTGCVDAMQ
jgi:hypothetical protein